MTFVEQNQEVKTFATKAPAQSLAHCVGLGGSHGRPQNSHTQVRQTLVDVLSEAAVANRSRVRSKKLASEPAATARPLTSSKSGDFGNLTVSRISSTIVELAVQLPVCDNSKSIIVGPNGEPDESEKKAAVR